MRRRRLLFAAPLALAGCGLSERPYVEQREWPLVIRRPIALPPRARGRVLLLRGITAAPGAAARGLRSLQPDGSVRTDFYEEWAVPPAEAVESDLRQWLAASGLFAAVVAPGSALAADLVLEGVLTALLADPAARMARASLALVLVNPRPSRGEVLMQRTFTAAAPLAADDGPGIAGALTAALGQVFEQIGTALAGFA